MGACVSAPAENKILPNPRVDEPWRIGIVPVARSMTNDCYITKDTASGPKWLYLRRAATQASSAASYFLESFVPDVGRFPDANCWNEGNGTVLCAAKANELGPSCFTMWEWPLPNTVPGGQYPDGGYTSDDGELRRNLEMHPKVMQRCRWTLKAEAYIYEDAEMKRQAGTLHMSAYGKQYRQMHCAGENSDKIATFIYRKLSGIKYYYTSKNNPEVNIPIVYRGRILWYIISFNRFGGVRAYPAFSDRTPPSSAFDSPIFKAKPPIDPKINKPKEIKGLASAVPPAVGMIIAYLATTAMGPEAILRNMPVFRFWPADVGLSNGTVGRAGYEVVPMRRPDPPTPVAP